MTVHKYRFVRGAPISQARLRGVVGPTATIVASDGGQQVDIESDDATDNVDILKEQLGLLGFTFTTLDPTDDPGDSFTPKGAGGGGGGGGFKGIWKFNTSTGGGDPGSKKVAFDSGTFAGVLFMYINDTADDPTFDFGTFFTFVNIGGQVYIQQNDDKDSAGLYEITSIADSTGFWTFGLSPIGDAGGTMIGNNKATTVVFGSAIKHNTTATTDPGTGDDADDGYAKLSHWINTTSDEVFICADPTVAAAVWSSLTSGGGVTSVERWFFADKLSIPVTADWAISVPGPLAENAANSGLHDILMDDTTEQATGFEDTVPDGMGFLTVKTIVKPANSPGGASVVKLLFREREITDNAAVTAWGSPIALTDVDMPITEIYYQLDTIKKSLGDWGLAAGKTFQIAVSRTSTGDTLTGDSGLKGIGVLYSVT